MGDVRVFISCVSNEFRSYRNALRKAFRDADIIDDLVAEFRRRDQQLLKLQAEFGAQEGLRKLREGFTLERER